MTVIGIGHIARVGKDEVARHLVEKHGYTRLSTADMIREFCYELNPLVEDGARYQAIVDVHGDASKDVSPEVRRLQQEVGQLMRNLYGQDFWVERLSDRISEEGGDVVVPDIRFPNEIGMVNFHEGYSVRVDRPGYKPLDHITDQALVGFTLWDFIIDNDGDIELLRDRTDAMLDILHSIDVYDTINVAEWLKESA